MSEYMEKHTVSRIIGSPPGYVGFDEGGQLTEMVRRKPFSIILLDEIEKAHPDVFNVLLQILDEGHLTDGKGRKVNFKNTIIIMTSNLGTRDMERGSLGFEDAQTQKETEESNFNKMRDKVIESLHKSFRPEFLNRLDEIIVFKRLGKEEIRKIVDLELSKAETLIKGQGIEVEFSDSLRKWLSEEGFSDKLGARPLKRLIQKEIENAVSDKIIDGSLKKGDTMAVGYGKDGVILKITKTEPREEVVRLV